MRPIRVGCPQWTETLGCLSTLGCRGQAGAKETLNPSDNASPCLGRHQGSPESRLARASQGARTRPSPLQVRIPALLDAQLDQPQGPVAPAACSASPSAPAHVRPSPVTSQNPNPLSLLHANLRPFFLPSSFPSCTTSTQPRNPTILKALRLVTSPYSLRSLASPNLSIIHLALFSPNHCPPVSPTPSLDSPSLTSIAEQPVLTPSIPVGSPHRFPFP